MCVLFLMWLQSQVISTISLHDLRVKSQLAWWFADMATSILWYKYLLMCVCVMGKGTSCVELFDKY